MTVEMPAEGWRILGFGAGERIEEAAGLRAAIGAAPAPTGAVILAGWRGRESETLALTRRAVPVMTGRGSGLGLVVIDYATAVQYNGLGRYGVALTAVRNCVPQTDGPMGQWVLPEVIEAAVRTGNPLLAGEALDLLATLGAAGGNEWVWASSPGAAR